MPAKVVVVLDDPDFANQAVEELAAQNCETVALPSPLAGQFSFFDGCPADWQKLPIPEGRIAVGLDGGYVRNWEDKKSNFEVIVGRLIPEAGSIKIL